MPGQIRVGTSGWNYRHWRGPFYPKDLPQKQWFDCYAGTFDTVEINNTFYNHPQNTTFDAWKKQAPQGFLYAVKANRYLTHLKRLKDCQKPLQRFLRGVRRLKVHLGPILYQLPPNWRLNLERMEAFVRLLPTDLMHVVEFRDRDWLCAETYDVLNNYGVGLCVHDMLHRHPRRLTGPVAYVRFHGSGEKYGGKYRTRRLRSWASWIRDVAGDHDVFAYFNNDQNAYAVSDATTLREMVGRR